MERHANMTVDCHVLPHYHYVQRVARPRLPRATTQITKYSVQLSTVNVLFHHGHLLCWTQDRDNPMGVSLACPPVGSHRGGACAGRRGPAPPSFGSVEISPGLDNSLPRAQALRPRGSAHRSHSEIKRKCSEGTAHYLSSWCLLGPRGVLPCRVRAGCCTSDRRSLRWNLGEF